ncbi:MAG: hypothetical protein KGL39_46515 [Patescibacteria group bacterium]|nr:hypothetical protein [Patescibacteria group bacterium]
MSKTFSWAIQEMQHQAITQGTSTRLCQHCGKREATQNFTTDGTAFSHGWMQRWCDICVLEVQVKHARERARALPELARELKRLRQCEYRANTKAKESHGQD